MVHAGLRQQPDGVRLSERHRHDPTADDWVLLLDGWTDRLRATGRDDAVLEQIKGALPSVGYQLTRRGIRRRAAAPSTGCSRAARPRSSRWPRSSRPSTATSGRGCGCWCSATTSRRPRRCPPTSRACCPSRPAPRGSRSSTSQDGAPRPAPAARHRPDRRRVGGDPPGAPRVRRDLRPGPRPARRTGHLDQPRLGPVGHPVLRGGPLPRPGRDPWAARRGLGRPLGHRAGRPDHRDDQHRRRADPRAGAAHRPVLAREGRADLERGVRQRGPPQGRQRLGPVRPQARRVLRRGRRGRGGRRRRARRRRPVAVRPAAGRHLRRRQRADAGPLGAARGDPGVVGRRHAVPRHARAHRADPAERRRARRSWCRRPWCCTATTCGSATTGSRRGDRTSRSPSASCSR